MDHFGSLKSKMEPWNLLELQPPPTCTVNTPLRCKDVREAKNIVYSAMQTLKKLKVLHLEAAYLSRYLYKFKRIFRHDKGLQHLVKVNQALQRYLKLDYFEALSNLKKCFPPSISSGSSHAYLPTRQMVKWVLLRTLSLAKIFVRIITESQNAGKFILAKLCLGWSSTYQMFALGITSRIQACAKFVVSSAIEWYNGLRPLVSAFQETTSYLEDFEFPTVLEDFIGKVDIEPPEKKTDIDKIFELIDLTGVNEDSDEDVCILNEIVVELGDSGEESDKDVMEVVAEGVRKSSKRGKKRKRSTSEEEISVVHEKINRATKNIPPPAKTRVLEDLGEPVVIYSETRTLGKKRKKKFNRDT